MSHGLNDFGMPVHQHGVKPKTLSEYMSERDDLNFAKKLLYQRSKNLYETGRNETDPERDKRIKAEGLERIQGRIWLMDLLNEWETCRFQTWTMFEVELIKLLLVKRPELFANSEEELQ